jgi:hypothetical protein
LGARARHCLLLGALRECRLSIWVKRACAR